MKKLIIWLAILVPTAITTGLIIYASGQDLAILNTGGEIARRQHELLSFAFWLSMIVIIPVFALTIFISIRYKSSKESKAKYTPDWAHNATLETVWWGIPIIIIIVLSAVTWRTSHTLDPYKPLDNANTPIKVQVVALQWKWLFLYPEQNIATVNQLIIPEQRPINFEITADAPMNSFWIPKLGGQVYAMSGMSTKLHLIADSVDEYNGVSANISGEGFADMKFAVKSMTGEDFDNWVRTTRYKGKILNNDTYDKLAKPSTLEEPGIYSRFTPGLYDTIISKYMPHNSNNTQQQPNAGHGDH